MTRTMALKPAAITRLQGKSAFRMGPPPEPGKPGTTGVTVGVEGVDWGVEVGVAVGMIADCVAVGPVAGVGVAVDMIPDCVAVGPVAGVGVAVGMIPDCVAVGVVVGCVGVGVLVGCVDVGVLVGGTEQNGPVTVLVSIVTAPVCANTRPVKFAAVFMEIDVSAKTFPMNEVPVPRVAELPILHHTLQGSPPVTDEPGDVIRVVTVLKIQTPDPTRDRFPVNEKLLVEQ
jgi:hypothetical protein